MSDEFIEHETWYFKDTREAEIKALYPDIDDKGFEFIMDKFCGLHMIHLVAELSELQKYFEDMFTESLADTKITRKLYQGEILESRDGKLIVLTKKDIYETKDILHLRLAHWA